MPTLMLRGLSADLAARLRTYAERHEIGRAAAAVHLLTIALDHLDARAAGAERVNAGRSAEQRSEAARRAVTARWARSRQE